MATVTGYTAERMKQIEDETVVDGHVDGAGHLILETRSPTVPDIDAGSVIGPVGPTGPSFGPSTDAGNDITAGSDTKPYFDRQAAVAGNTIVYASLAAAKAAVPAPPDGLFGYLLDEDSLIIGKGGTWRWYRKTFPHTLGNSAFISWAALVTAASCYVNIQLAGRGLILQIAATVATPVTGSNATYATLAAPYRPLVRQDVPGCPGHSTGAGSGRASVQPTGDLAWWFTGGDNSVAVGSWYAIYAYQIADLVVA